MYLITWMNLFDQSLDEDSFFFDINSNFLPLAMDLLAQSNDPIIFLQKDFHALCYVILDIWLLVYWQTIEGDFFLIKRARAICKIDFWKNSVRHCLFKSKKMKMKPLSRRTHVCFPFIIHGNVDRIEDKYFSCSCRTTISVSSWRLFIFMTPGEAHRKRKTSRRNILVLRIYRANIISLSLSLSHTIVLLKY